MIVLCSVLRTCLEIFQGIMHPSHVPFIVKSKPALIDRLGHILEICRILCRQKASRISSLQFLIHQFDELHSVSIDTALFISLPVNDPADGIHTQTIKMVFLQPVICRRLQKASHLSAGMHKVAAAPFTDPHICMRIFI